MPPTTCRSMDADLAVADVCQAELLSEAQTALAILADVDRRYEALSHRLDVQRRQRSAGPAVLKESLHWRQRRERTRAVQRLIVVQRRISELIFNDLTSSA